MSSFGRCIETSYATSAAGVLMWTNRGGSMSKPAPVFGVLPVAAVMVLLKWLYDLSPLKHLELSPLLAGVIAAEVFIVGFILSGTAADFKEAERLPGEVVGSLDSIADECLIMDE